MVKTLVFDNMPGNYVHHNIADVHNGNSAKSTPTIKKFKTEVKKDKHAYISGGGDLNDTILVDDPRFSLDIHLGLAARLDVQRDTFIEEFGDISAEWLWIIDGNHERRLKNKFRINKDIAKALGAEYANCSLVKAIFPQYRVADWHGYGVINSLAGDPLQRKINNMISLKRKLRNLPAHDCEVIYSHHFHKVLLHPPQMNLNLITDRAKKELVQTYSEPSRIWIDKKKDLYRIPEEDKWYACCGSFLRGYQEGVSTYVEERGYAPTELGYIKTTVKNDKLYKIEEVIL
jgi:hypothetical protein